MSIFDNVAGEKETPKEKPEKQKKKETSKTTTKKESPISDVLNPELIKQIKLGGIDINEEINRPFWHFPDTPYPYEHDFPAYIFIIGDKGSSKTTIAFSYPGNILALTFEKRGNIIRPWSRIFSCTPRIQTFGIAEYIERETKVSYQTSSDIAYLKSCELLTRASKLEKKFDWVVLDGLQMTQQLTTQRMKKLNAVGAFDNLPKKLLTRWGERTLYLENLVMTLASAVSTKGVILTSQNVMHRAMFLTQEEKDSGMKEEDIPVKEPAWKGKVKDDVDTIIFTQIKEERLGVNRTKMKFYATVSTNKLGGALGSHDITLHDNDQATKELVKEILTSEMGFKIE